MSTIITGQDNLDMYRLLTWKAALRLEVAGMKHSRGSVYQLVKDTFGFKGSKQKVLDQLIAHIDRVKKDRQEGSGTSI